MPGRDLVARRLPFPPGPRIFGPPPLSSTSDRLAAVPTAAPGTNGRSEAPVVTREDRGSERRRAVQLARHYRDQENLTIAEIARRLGRAEATVKAYLYDPSDDNKRPSDSPQERQFWALAGHAPTSICEPLTGCRSDGTRPALPDCPIRPGAEVSSVVIAVPGTAPNSWKQALRQGWSSGLGVQSGTGSHDLHVPRD